MEKVTRLPVPDPRFGVAEALTVTEIYRAGWADCLAAMTASPRPALSSAPGAAVRTTASGAAAPVTPAGAMAGVTAIRGASR